MNKFDKPTLNIGSKRKLIECSCFAAQSLFLATISEDRRVVTSGDVIVWDVAPININGDYNVETGGFTVPTDGLYK